MARSSILGALADCSECSEYMQLLVAVAVSESPIEWPPPLWREQQCPVTFVGSPHHADN